MTTVDFLASFPIPTAMLPPRLRSLLEPIGLSPLESVEVTSNLEFDPNGSNEEIVHMIMAAVPESVQSPLEHFDESGDGVISHSVPVLRNKGDSKNFSPSVSGHDYIVASWGNGSFYSFNLAEKAWMMLGLTPRCLGNDEQRLVYDDLSVPEFEVAAGQVSNEYHYSSSRNVSWRMSNEYLRKYLWMRGARGVRTFFYQARCPNNTEFQKLLGGKNRINIKPDNGWFEIDIRVIREHVLLQVWATVDAVSCELCPEQTSDGLIWPGIANPVTRTSAVAIFNRDSIYLNDKFLERYEQNSTYGSTPFYDGHWNCCPSYRGQWAFTDCRRVGRNLIKVPLYELYKPKPDQEILRAHKFAVDPSQLTQFNLNVEHIVSKTNRLLEQLLLLGENLSSLGNFIGLDKSASDIIGFSRAEIHANGWASYPALRKLCQVAPLDMTQQGFLSRCKSIHEVWQKVPNGFLKAVLKSAGCPQHGIKDLGSLKSLQVLLNLIESADAHDEAIDAFKSTVEPDNWKEDNARMAPLFVVHDLRIADAHDSFDKIPGKIQDLGFDTASLKQGYGLALDFILDQVIDSFAHINRPLKNMLNR